MARKILIVDDNEDARYLLTVLLRQSGYEPIEAANGTQGMERALSEKPDLILMDLGLPDISGIDVTKQIKQNSTTAYIPIIAYTAQRANLWRGKALDAGMVGYLEKHNSIGVVMATIARFLADCDLD
jgi:two-component system cell cycle response regulator DivK